MSTIIFVSHAPEDSHRIAKLEQWSRYDRLGPGVKVTKDTGKLKPAEDPSISKSVEEKINDCDVLLVLLGNETGKYLRIQSEVEFAQSQDKRVVVIKLPYSSGTLPEAIDGLPVLSFEPAIIAKAIL